jgi:DNA-binding IclR family transcriptional regulator
VERIAWTNDFRTASDSRVLAALATWADPVTGDHARPTIASLVRRSGRSSGTVKRSLRRLKEEGWIVATARGHGQPPTYRICVERLTVPS